MKAQYLNHTATISSPLFIPFYSYRNKYYIKSKYNDTVFTINGDKIQPSYFINLGKYQIPPEKRFERLSAREARSLTKNISEYFFSSVLEAGNKLFLTADAFEGDNKLQYFIINRGGFISNENNKYLGVFYSWIENDWDGGAFFWPKGSIDYNRVFMPIYVSDIKNNPNSLISFTKFPDKRSYLEKMVSDKYIVDNPLLMVVTLKNE